MQRNESSSSTPTSTAVELVLQRVLDLILQVLGDVIAVGDVPGAGRQSRGWEKHQAQHVAMMWQVLSYVHGRSGQKTHCAEDESVTVL
jgi:hypothetical protein